MHRVVLTDKKMPLCPPSGKPIPSAIPWLSLLLHSDLIRLSAISCTCISLLVFVLIECVVHVHNFSDLIWLSAIYGCVNFEYTCTMSCTCMYM